MSRENIELNEVEGDSSLQFAETRSPETTNLSLIANETSPLLNTAQYMTYLKDNFLNVSYLLWKYKIEFIFAAIAFYSEIGYLLAVNKISNESLNGPLERYLYPHLSDQTANAITKTSNIAIMILVYLDAIMILYGVSNIRHWKHKFIEELKQGISEVKTKTLNFWLFVASLGLFYVSFLAGSAAPATGLAINGYSENMFGIISAPIMVLGQLILNSLSGANYIFSSSRKIQAVFNMSRSQKKEILANIFYSKAGYFIFISSIINTVNRSWVFFGLQCLTNRYVLPNFIYKSDVLNFGLALVAAVCAAYTTVMTEGIQHYNRSFGEENSIEINELMPSDKCLSRSGQKAAFLVLGFLCFSVWVLHTIVTPSLYTGEIEDPEDNYNVKDSILAIMGIILGGFAAAQYAYFEWNLSRISILTFFSRSCSIESTDIASSETVSDALGL